MSVIFFMNKIATKKLEEKWKYQFELTKVGKSVSNTVKMRKIYDLAIVGLKTEIFLKSFDL